MNTQKKESDEREELMKQNISALQVLSEKWQKEKTDLEFQLKAAEDSLQAASISHSQTAEADPTSAIAPILAELAHPLNLALETDLRADEMKGIILSKILEIQARVTTLQEEKTESKETEGGEKDQEIQRLQTAVDELRQENTSAKQQAEQASTEKESAVSEVQQKLVSISSSSSFSGESKF